MYTSTVQSANAALLPHPCLQTSYPPSAHYTSSPTVSSPPSLAPGCPSVLPASCPSLTLSGFFNRMLEVFDPGALNYFTFSRTILSTLSASRKLILTRIPLSRFLDSLISVQIAPTPDLAFSLLMPHMLAAALSLSSSRPYPFLNFLHPLFLCSIPTLILQRSTSLLTTPTCSLFLMCMPPYLLLPIGWQNRSFSSLLQKSLHSVGLQLPSPPLGLKRYF